MNPRLHINALRLFAETKKGELSRTLHFSSGLNLLRADNTSGKSTALLGIVYALGLEGMLSPSRRIPLPYAMTDQVPIDETMEKVIRSGVSLEIVNESGRVITVSRSVVDRTKDPQLVTVTYGPALSNPSEFPREDFFVRRPGAAQNYAGFHRFLEDFLNLNLPRVTRRDGSEGPLYLETLFPYSFVKQKHGWSGIQARIPRYFGIRDVGRRSAEFILGLDSFERVLRTQRIRSNIKALETDWLAHIQQAREIAKISKVVIQNLPERIRDGMVPTAFVPTVFMNDSWMPIDEAIELIRQTVLENNRAIQTAEDAAPEIEQNLRVAEAALNRTLGLAAGLAQERNDLEYQQQQLALRLESLEEDLQRHKDSQILERLGSEHAHSLLEEHLCPTCRQNLNDGAEISSYTMTVSENIEFINQQIATFRSSENDVTRVIDAVSARQQDLSGQIREYRRQIRAARETLTHPSSLPSVADISRQVSLEARADDLESRREQLAKLQDSMRHLNSEWVTQQDLLKELEKSELSARDREKITMLTDSLRGQLRAYGFESFDPNDIEINESTLRPIHEGFDLGFNLSASDMIRVIWAYLFAMLQVGTKDGNHLGLLIFDEPRQQETARPSYQALLAHASSLLLQNTQVIFATSEPSENLIAMLDQQDFNLINIPPDEKLLH